MTTGPNQDDIDQKRFDAFGLLAIVSTQCMGPHRLPVMYGIRETANNISDSGWILSSGHESVDFSSDPEIYKLVPLEMMIETDATLAPLRDFPGGNRDHSAAGWRALAIHRRWHGCRCRWQSCWRDRMKLPELRRRERFTMESLLACW